MNDRQLLHQTDSGPIELVWDKNDDMVRLQFNCRCEDALPYCHAMCCRNRTRYNVEIEADEAHKYDTQPLLDVLSTEELITLQTVGNNCCYLAGDKCSIHATKPKRCQLWHCSPGGKGDGLTERSSGWDLQPSMKKGS